MRTRFLPKMTNCEVDEYLKRNDIIFVPVGTVEMHGGLPMNCETVFSEAFALKMAEKVDGLVLSDLTYFYAGATASGRGTVQVSVRTGIDYLMEIARSLLRQGFKRQVYISFHGPAHMTCSPVMRDFFDETKVPILYLDLIMGMAKVLKGGPHPNMDAVNKMFFGGYEVMGKLEEIPLTSELPMDYSEPWVPTVAPFDSVLSQVAYQSGGYGYYFGDTRDHGTTPRVESPEKRKELALEGVEIMDQIVESMDLPGVVEKMKDVETFVQTVVIPECGAWLP